MDPVQPIIPATPPMESVPILPPPVKKSNSLIVIGIALLVVSLASLAAYFAFQYYQLKSQVVVSPIPLASASPVATSDPTANWKTYSDSAKTYTFKYPGTETIVNELPSVLDSTKLYFLISKQEVFNLSTIPVCSADNIKSLCVSGKSPEDLVPQITQLKIDNKDAISFRVSIPSTPPNGSIILRVVQIKSPAIEIAYPVDGSGLEEIFNQILSTFKFTE